ncbi:hypothetical protein DAMO_0868 [Candidatus Methylomirabilis oxygeniifera]|uniref:Uncharacterized protein n=1 Tax=Methylomirabilis oxygeniifera TaxID=671143 RepID=D5MM43_METO1|nr:hypothetical protein DAMO_0868 [Candidatus Methylomirabilis oxyfera]
MPNLLRDLHCSFYPSSFRGTRAGEHDPLLSVTVFHVTYYTVSAIFIQIHH